jgi:16S rRNA (guanine527-N7)-methyltransferase
MSADVSRETRERLDDFTEMVLTWNRRINLIGPCDIEAFRLRHLEDCIQVADLIHDRATTVVDLGSGAGLPGLIIAICRPSLRVTCVESDARKAVYLREAVRRLHLDVDVLNGRIEVARPQGASIVTARGLAPLPKLLGYVARHLAVDGRALLMKGRRWQEELEQARRAWQFSVEAASSRTDPQAVILSIGGLTRA